MQCKNISTEKWMWKITSQRADVQKAALASGLKSPLLQSGITRSNKVFAETFYSWWNYANKNNKLFYLQCFPISCKIYIEYNIGGKKSDIVIMIIILNGTSIHFHHSINWLWTMWCHVWSTQHKDSQIALFELLKQGLQFSLASILSYHLCQSTLSPPP